MTYEQLKTAIEEELAHNAMRIQTLLDAYAPVQDERRLVRPGENLQGALDDGGDISLEAGATYEAQRFVFSKPTHLRGALGTRMVGTAGPAGHVKPGSSDIVIDSVQGYAKYQSVWQLGDNDARTQSRLEDVPQRITLSRCGTPQHLGKTVFEVNAADVTLFGTAVSDVYDPAGSDSKAIAILNTPGPVTVVSAVWSAGSMFALVGGDTMKIPGVIPSDITYVDSTFFRPAAWRELGQPNRRFKCGLEWKTGRRIAVRRCTIDGCPQQAQPEGFAILLTPTRGGEIVGAVFEDLFIRNVSSGFNVNAYDTWGINHTRTTGIEIRRVDLVTNAKELGGHGRFALLQNGVGTFDCEEVTAVIDGTALLMADKGRLERVSFLNGRAVAGKYGFSFAGQHNTDRWHVGDSTGAGGVDQLDIRGNLFANAEPKLRANFPDNRYVTRELFNAEIGEGP